MATVAQIIAREIERLERVMKDPAHPNYQKNRDDARATIEHAEREHLPSGSGFDSGCEVDREKSGPEKLVIRVPFHHMDENGGYDGWEHYVVIATPSFHGDGLTIVVKGGRKDHREYVADQVGYDLAQELQHIDPHEPVRPTHP